MLLPCLHHMRCIRATRHMNQKQQLHPPNIELVCATARAARAAGAAGVSARYGQQLNRGLAVVSLHIHATVSNELSMTTPHPTGCKLPGLSLREAPFLHSPPPPPDPTHYQRQHMSQMAELLCRTDLRCHTLP